MDALPIDINRISESIMENGHSELFQGFSIEECGGEVSKGVGEEYENMKLSSKNGAVSEKFILELLSLPELTRKPDKAGRALGEEISDISTDTGDLCMSWEVGCMEEGGIGGDMEALVGGSEGETTAKVKEKGKEGKGKDSAGGSELRSRRRREFHKIHTRRSRAKLNEKMELLRRMLPEPPSGMVVKSKAQIIDYAITVLGQLSLRHMENSNSMNGGE